jgi:5'-methylthioadenosine phosphorylase
MVTDYDCWHPDHGSVDVASVIAILQKNAATAGDAVRTLCETLSGQPRTVCASGIETNLDVSIITPPEARDPKLVTKLDAVAGRVLG